MKTKTTSIFAAAIVLYGACTKENTTIKTSSTSAESSVQTPSNNIDEPAANVGSVTIGTQIWMKKDLTVSHYRNGDPIPQAQDGAAWRKLTTGAWCWYKNNPALGKLYNGYAVNDPRGLAPEGWHVPSDAEWDTLTRFLGGRGVAAGKMKETGIAHWQAPNLDASNSSGFTALPGGSRAVNGDFQFAGYSGNWWSSTEGGTRNRWSWGRNISYYSGYINRNNFGSYGGFSVRCIKN